MLTLVSQGWERYDYFVRARSANDRSIVNILTPRRAIECRLGSNRFPRILVDSHGDRDWAFALRA